MMAKHEEPGSLPLNELVLFRGAKVALIRNLQPSAGLANGKTFIVKEIKQRSVVAIPMDGDAQSGNEEIFFRIAFKVTTRGMYSFTRIQYPLRLAFASTVHKYQGQGIPTGSVLLFDLRVSRFAHSQDYVGFSRARESLQVLTLQNEPLRWTEAFVTRDFLRAADDLRRRQGFHVPIEQMAPSPQRGRHYFPRGDNEEPPADDDYPQLLERPVRPALLDEWAHEF